MLLATGLDKEVGMARRLHALFGSVSLLFLFFLCIEEVDMR